MDGLYMLVVAVVPVFRSGFRLPMLLCMLHVVHLVRWLYIRRDMFLPPYISRNYAEHGCLHMLSCIALLWVHMHVLRG